jgi:hypothetical protein
MLAQLLLSTIATVDCSKQEASYQSKLFCNELLVAYLEAHPSWDSTQH